MNKNFKIIKCHQYLNAYCNDLITEENFQPNTKLFYASFLINSFLYDLNHLNSNNTNYIKEEKSNIINTLKTEENEQFKRESDWFNSEYPKLIPPKKRWGNTFDSIQ